MNDSELIAQLATVMLSSSPLIIAVVGETITERVGVVNLSLDGTILLAAMASFVVAFEADGYLQSGTALPILLGFLVAALVGALFAFIVAFGSIRLRRDQVAIGFVLTLLGDDLSRFLGQHHTRIVGPAVTRWPIPVLKDIPIIGPIFFDQGPVVYFAIVITFVAWWWIFRTQPGLKLRGVGERPAAAFARGVNVNRLRYVYALVGGGLVGIAGAAYSLRVRLGWSDAHTLGLGWIALAIVIFGGWYPMRAALGVILFTLLNNLATNLQSALPNFPLILLNSVQWILMIGVLLLIGGDLPDRLLAVTPAGLRPVVERMLRVQPPAALGTAFVEE